MQSFAPRINKIASKINAKNYLEIGVCEGGTFNNVNISNKIAVDPAFRFNTTFFTNDKTHFFSLDSNEFFNQLPNLTFSNLKKPYKFDIIFIDGLHTFEQSYLDFVNAIKYSDDNTIFIFDDTVPCDPYSGHPSQNLSYTYRKLANLPGRPWHGDVYKTVFAIHDFHPLYSYATIFGSGNPQTVVWKTKIPRHDKQFFNNIEDIKKISYLDLLDMCVIFNPASENDVLSLIGSVNECCIDRHKETLQKVINPLR